MARLVLICLASVLVVALAGPLQQHREGNNRRDQQQQQRNAGNRQDKDSHRKKSSGTLQAIGNCQEKDNTFKSGHSYEYKYFGKAETGLGYGDAKTVGLAFDCQVRLSVPQPCEYRLKVTSCEVFEHDGTEDDDEDQEGHRTLSEEVRHLEGGEASRRGYKKSDRSQELSKMVSQHDIQAQVADGEVARVVYKDQEEMWVVNFKKAILDALQVDTSAERQDERQKLTMVNGIHGLCPTKKSEKSTGENVIIERDLDSCIHRRKNNFELSPLSPVFNMSLVAKVMKAESVCSYKLERQSHIQRMTCRETHHFLALPWTKIAAATANVTQTLRFVRKDSTAQEMDRSLDSQTITSILYEHENATDVQRKDGQGDADEILRELVNKAVDGLDIDAPALFDDFVEELRDSSNLDDVIALTRGLKENEQEVAKYLLVQGLVQCNAPACLRALTTLMQSDEIPRAVFEPVVMALALSKQQDPLFLDEVKRICESRPTRTCALMVGALAHNLVEEDENILEDEESAKPIEEAAQFLMNLIEDGKCEPSDKLDKADEDSDATRMIIALKAIGNLGHVGQRIQESTSGRQSSGRIEEKIGKCLKDSQTPDNVTVAAIHAYRRFMPTREISEQLLAVLANQDESAEVRMAACMASVRMASDKQAVRQIVEVMEREESEQVKTFMASHLRAVMKSEDPNYKKIAEHLKAVLQEKGQSSLPKTKARIPHSLHIELSKFYQIPMLDEEENDFGVQIESTSMFSTKSYLPKSMQLNISTQVFGDYINVLETGVDMRGVENLVEKVLGPKGVISKSTYLKQAREGLARIIQTVEELGFKHLRFEDAKELSEKFFQLIQSKAYGNVIDRVLSAMQDIDMSGIEQIFSHIRSMDVDKILETIRQNVPQSAQLEKIVEKLRRIRFQDATTETLVQVLEAFGISAEKARDVIAQAKRYGVDVDELVRMVRRTDFEKIQYQLQNLRVDEIQQKIQTVIKTIMYNIELYLEYALPSYQDLVELWQKIIEKPFEFKEQAKKFLESRRRGEDKDRKRQESDGENDQQDDDEDDDAEQDRNDYESLDKMPWGKQVKQFRRQDRDEDGDGKDDSEDVDIIAFIRIFGDEIGFISLSDITDCFDMETMKKTFEKAEFRKILADIMDGFDIQPTIAAKMEGVHHLSTGLGLPLQITLNITGIATVHVKVQPESSSLRQSVVEFEPSAAVQVAGGMTIDLPSIHSIAVVSNTTVKSEFEIKMRLDMKKDSIELDIQKPDEELDIIHLRHEVKLVKDDEDFAPFDAAKSHEVKTTKCLPEAVERLTGLKICADLETSSQKGTPMLSTGPHELRVSVQESQTTGLRHMKFAGKRSQTDKENRYELNVRAPGHQLQREGRALISHDRQRNQVQMRFDSPQHTTPRAHVFFRNIRQEDTKFAYETGMDVEMSDDRHYNASVKILAKAKGYGYGGVVEMVKDAEFNYTVGASVQSPVFAVNVSTTTAKIEGKVWMEHNLTYYISDEIKMPALKNLRFPGHQERDDVSKFCVRHGVEVKSDRTAHDVQAFIQLLTFPLMDLAEPTIQHVAQIKIHRDYRHIGLHSNTTWLNDQDQLEYFNVSATANNIPDLIRLQSDRSVSVNFNVSRNDWHVAARNQLKKQDDEVALKQEITAQGMIPDCRTYIDCAVKRVKADLKSVASIRKVKTTGVRPHHHHQTRPARQQEDGVTFRHRQMTVTVENRLKEKKQGNNENGFWNQRTSSGSGGYGQKAWQVKSSVVMKASGQPNKEMSAATYFGSDASERGAILSLYLVHNATATNIPFSFDHFAHILVDKQEGLQIITNSSLDKNDQSFFGVDTFLQIDPRDMEARAACQVNTPFLDGKTEVAVKKAGKAVEIQWKTNTEADSRDKEFLSHDMTATCRIAAGKVTQSLKVRHSKLDSDFKVDFDLFGGDNTDSGIGEDEDDEERSADGQQMQRRISKYDNKFNKKSRSPRSVNSRRSEDREEENDVQTEQNSDSWSRQYENRHGSARRNGNNDYQTSSTTERSSQKTHKKHSRSGQNQDEDEETSAERRNQETTPSSDRNQNKHGKHSRNGQNENDGQTSSTATRRHSKNQKQSRTGQNEDDNEETSAERRSQDRKQSRDSHNQRRSKNSRRDEEDSQDGESRQEKSRHTFDSLKRNFGAIKPTVTGNLRINSKDRELIPSLTVDGKMSALHAKLDVEIREVPRSMENLLTSKRFTLQADIEQQKAVVKMVIGQRGEAGAEVAFHGDRKAEAKIYDRDMMKSGETVHLKLTLELPSDNQIRSKITIHPESAPKIARAIQQTGKAAVEASTRFMKESSEASLHSARRMYSDASHPVYDVIRPYKTGSMEQWKTELVQAARELQGQTSTTARGMYENDEVFGTSLKEFVRKIDEERQKLMRAIMELLEHTPVGAIMQALPSTKEAQRTLEREISQVLNKHFPEQMRVLKTHFEDFEWKAAIFASDSGQKIQKLVTDLVKSVDHVKARELADKAVQAVRDLLLDFIRGVKEAAKKNDMVKKYADMIDIQAVEEMVRQADSMTMESVIQSAKAFSNLAKSLAGEKLRSMVQQNGDETTVTIDHPFQWSSLKQLPKLTEEQRRKSANYLQQAKRTFQEMTNDNNVHIPLPGHDDGLRFKWSDLTNLHRKNLPTQTAMIFGERHIMTFDGKVYSIPRSGHAQCTYLMARGTRQENFALVKTGDGVTLTLPEMSVTINAKNEVRLNGSRTVVQLPVESANRKMSVKLVGNTVNVESDTGITLKFNGEQKVYIIELSTGMWDESTGLLGSNDNEASNDWKMPTGKRAQHAEEFVNAYELSKGSQCQLTKAGDSQTNSRRGSGPQCKESSKCASFFRSTDSELATCFQIVEAENFLAACEAETRDCNQTASQEIVCDIVQAYRKICDIKGVETETPEECETCQGRKENSQWNIRGNQHQVDLVVVVSEHQDTQKDLETPAEKIRALMETISRKLQQWNSQDVRVALVGYSGAGVHKEGHTHTVDNKQFDSINKLPQALKTLKFKGREQADVLEAIDFVVESHDFRPEATKIVLVFGPEERQFVSGGRHQSVQEKLMQRGITVTVFAKYDELKERDLGINFDGSILTTKSFSEQSSQHKSEMPSRRMSRLAKATRGAIFKLDSVLGTSDATKKTQAADTTAETILEQIKREENLCKTCVCQQTDFNQLISACKVSACA